MPSSIIHCHIFFSNLAPFEQDIVHYVTDKIWAIILDFVLEAAERYSIDATELLADFIESNPVAHTLRNMYIYKQAS